MPYAVKREAVAHDSQAESGDFASASHIRELIKEGGEWQKFVPYDFEGCKPSFTRQAGREMLFKLCKEYGTFQLLRACGAEIINGTIIDAMLCKGVFDRRSTLLVFVHNEKLCFRQALDKSSKVRIT